MKQFSLLAALLLVGRLFAGTIELTDVPSAPIAVDMNAFYGTAHIQVKNTAGTTKNFQAARLVNNVQPGQSSYYCWGWCLGPNTDSTLDPVVLSTNASSQLDIYFTPSQIAGEATITIRIYEQEDTTNYADVTVVFNSTTDVEAGLGAIALENAFPVPATTTLTATYRLPQGAAILSLTDLAGQEVRRQSLATGSTSATLDLNGLAAGTYILRMVADNRAAGTRIVTVK